MLLWSVIKILVIWNWVFISLFLDLVFEPEDITSETGLRDVNDMARILRKLFIDGNYYCLFFCVPIFLGNGKGQFSRGWNVNYVLGNCLPNKVWRDYRSRLLVRNFIIIFWWRFVIIVIIIFQRIFCRRYCYKSSFYRLITFSIPWKFPLMTIHHRHQPSH